MGSRGLKRLLATAACVAVVLGGAATAYADEDEQSDATPVCVAAQTLAATNLGAAAEMFEVLDELGIQCDPGSPDLVADPERVADALLARVGLDEGVAEALTSVAESLVPPPPADETAGPDLCADVANALQAEGRQAAAAAVAAALGDSCKLDPPASLEALSLALLTAAQAEQAKDAPDQDVVEELLAAAEDLATRETTNDSEGSGDDDDDSHREDDDDSHGDDDDNSQRAEHDDEDDDDESGLLAAIERERGTDLERASDDLGDDLRPLLAALGWILVAVLLLWLLVRMAGQLRTPSRWWRRLIRRSPRSEFWKGSGAKVALAVATAALLVGFAVAGGLGNWAGWVAAALLLAVAFVTMSLLVHGPHVRFKIEDFGDETKAAATHVASWVRRLSRPEGPGGVDKYEAPDTAIESVPEAASKLDKSGLVAAVVALAANLVPDRSYRLTGSFRDTAKRIDMVLTLHQGRRVVGTVHVGTKKPKESEDKKDEDKKDEEKAEDKKDEEDKNNKDKDKEAPLGRVALAGAIWVSLELEKDSSTRVGKEPDDPPPLYGSSNWVSAALAAISVNRLAGGAVEERRRCAGALEWDPDNWVASFHLARLDMAEHRYEHAVARLASTRGAAMCAGEAAAGTDREHWYRATYNLAVAHMNLYLCLLDRCVAGKSDIRQPDQDDHHLHAALTESHALLEQARSCLPELPRHLRETRRLSEQHGIGIHEEVHKFQAAHLPEHRPRWRQDRRLFDFLRTSVIGPATVLLADVIQLWEAVHESIPPGGSVGAAELIDHLDATALRNARTRYNLACYHANRGFVAGNEPERKREFATALDELRLAMDGGPERAELAVRDPSLHPLRWARRKRFDEIVGIHDVKSADKPALAALPSLDDAKARLLWALPDPITKNAELVAAAGTRAQREALEEATGIPEAELREAALLADLGEQVAGTASHAGLLAAAEVGSIAALASWEPPDEGADEAEALRSELDRVRRLRLPDAKLPAAATIGRWLHLAAAATPQVD